MALELTTERINTLLTSADEVSRLVPPDELSGRHPGWEEDIAFLLDQSTPLTYLPVLCVTLVARMASPTVNVRRIQPHDEYSASLVGKAVVRYGLEHQIDVRTESTNVMNSQPFIRQAEITAELNEKPPYQRFFGMVESVQRLSPDDAREVLALVFQLGRKNWPNRYRRTQRNQAGAQRQLPPTTSDTTDTVSSFILNRSPREEFVHRDGEDYYGFHENVTSAQALVSAGGGRFVYYNTKDHAQNRMCFVAHGQITSVEEGEVDEKGRRTWIARFADYAEFPHPVPKAEGAPPRWNVQHSIVKISGTDFDRIVDLGMGRRKEPEPLTVAGVTLACTEEGLILTQQTITALVAALNSGKHVILTGPPGTAKTTLAVIVAQVAATQNLCAGHLLTTATADWSTYDTIGGLAPTEHNLLAYRAGRFVEALDSNLWLVVDEMNRSNFDRAFGQLFTVLAGADVTLPYNDSEFDNLPIRLRQESSASDSRYRDVVVGRDWRMIGTINNFDKALLFEMSFALMRRFAFIEVPAPDADTYRQLIASNVEDAEAAVGAAARAAVEALLPLRELKEFGPAIFIDAARMAHQLVLAGSEYGDTVVAIFYALFLPQLEGLDEHLGRRLLKLVTNACGHQRYRPELLRILREVLGLELLRADTTMDDDDREEAAIDDPEHDGVADNLSPEP